MREIIDNIKLGIQMIVIGAIILYVASLIFMPDMTMKIFRFQSFVVVTESMEPEIYVNDMVVATPFDVENAERGQIITFYADIDYNGTKEIVTHYIYEIDDSGSEPIIRTHRYFEEGETPVPDTWLIPASDVIGSYSFHVRYVGFLIGFIKSIYGIAVIAANIIIFGIIRFVNERARRKEEEREEALQLQLQHEMHQAINQELKEQVQNTSSQHNETPELQTN